MSNSSPADLAVAFRSLSRRLSQAPDETTPADVVAGASTSVQSEVAAAAALLGASPTADAVAAAITARHANDWTDADLAALQDHAMRAAKAIRTVEDSRR